MTGKSSFESLCKRSGSLFAFGLLDPGLRNASRSYGSATAGFLSVTGSAGAWSAGVGTGSAGAWSAGVGAGSAGAWSAGVGAGSAG
jgi:hypothetical protein